MPAKALTFGAVLWDIIEGKEYLGGAPFNVAAHLTQLGCASSIITRIGNDDLGQKAFLEMEDLGVDTSFVQRDSEHNTGTAEVTLTAHGVPAFVVRTNVAYEFIDLSHYDLERIKANRFDVLYFGTLEQRGEVSRNSLTRLLEFLQFKDVFYDVNIRMGFHPKEIIKTSFMNATIVKLNQDEANLISELLYGRALNMHEFARRVMIEFSLNVICITKGKEGCDVYSGNAAMSFPEHLVEVVDTVGAGDAFSAAFIMHFQRSRDPFESARLANIMGAFVASERGAVPAVSAEIKKLMGIKLYHS